jgi:hypothetical protein
VGTSPASTTRPIVRLFFAPDGRRTRLEDINLDQDRSRMIIQSGMSLAQVRAFPQTGLRAA